ncbi:hypothetical protein JX266_002093 [Neoarthrinium moseri]|nr:hypothetical protein JX266_002093 [Neoarthrinium moseri]
MAAGRALAAAGCSHCRTSVLRLFMSSSKPSPLARSQHTLLWSPVATTRHLLRSYSSASSSGHVTGSHVTPSPESPETARQAAQDGSASDIETLESAAAEPAPAGVPWYLQVEPPRHAPFAEPPPLPELPSGSPPILSAVLEYAAEEMGLDDLSLLDLREMDPPPALGPNLFMLFGTARSERHLNVSAGRLVRWLRAKHHVHADADGLLGPNERKTKLRRKAKRAKLLGTMGTDDADDGISTGWICVNLGTINRSHTESAVLSEDGRVAGFGVPQTGSTIVVQVMTEERRTELGLETLWQRALGRPSEERAVTSTETKKAADSHPLEKAILSKSPTRPTPGHQASDSSAFSGQTRSMSTTPIRDGPKPGEANPTDPLLSDLSVLQEQLLHDGPTKLRVLDLLRSYLQDVQEDQLSATLESAAFQKLSRLAMENLPAERTWSLRLAMASKTRGTMHGSPTLLTMQQLIRDLQLFAIPASRGEILELLSCIYSASAELMDRTQVATEVLDMLHTRGQPVLSNDVIVSIMDGLSWFGRPDDQSLNLQRRLEGLMVQTKQPYMGERLLISLMDAYARMHRWEQFWEAWRIPPRFAQPRSEAMYIHVYQLMAATDDPKRRALCADTVRRCFQEMIIENPPIEPAGRVLESLLGCIRVVDPRAEDHADTIPASAPGFARSLGNREFVRLVKDIKLLQRHRHGSRGLDV